MTTLRTRPKLLRTVPELAPKNMRFGAKRKTEFVIYAVVLREHPEIVKIGRSYDWRSRREQYATWNLCVSGDAIVQESAFLINEEYVDLPALERACLSEMPSFPVFGKEWFREEMDTACRAIDRVMCRGGLTYELPI